jgi:hypothetical protein
MATLAPSILLDIWEAGARRHPIDRAVLLLSLCGDETADALPDVPLGRRNRKLMDLRRARFGETFHVWLDCVECEERMSLEIGAGELPAAEENDRDVEVNGHAFRRPTSRDVAVLGDAPDAAAGARLLLQRCARDPDGLPTGPAFDALLGKVEAALDETDPWADLTLVAECPQCGHRQETALDVPGLVWDEIDSLAHGLLDDVHVLARAYGWSERDILGMSEARRAAYVSRVEA